MKKRKTILDYVIPLALVTLVYLYCQLNYSNLSNKLQGVLIPTCVFICMTLSLNLVVGISGELSLGHAGFMSVGAFTGVVISGYLLNGLGLQSAILRMILAVLGGGIMGGIIGALIGIPVLRLRGDYLAIVTLAFGEIIRNVLQCVYASVEDGRLHISFANPITTGTMLLNGPQGAVKVNKIATLTMAFVLLVITLLVVLNLVHSRSGRAIMAIRDNRIAAETTGLNVTKYKMMAFVTSAVLAGMAGAMYGLNIASFAAKKFDFNLSIYILVYVVMGGIGNMTGSIISATALYMLPEILRDLQKYRMLAYAVVLILIMLFTNNPILRSYINHAASVISGPFKKLIGAKSAKNEEGGTQK